MVESTMLEVSDPASVHSPFSSHCLRHKGRSARLPLLDICYTLSLGNTTWKAVELVTQPGDDSVLGAGQVYGHSCK